MASSTDLSKHEKRALRGANSVPRLLVSRRDAALMLGDIDVSSIRRLEKANLLRPIRLTRRGQVFFTYENVVALARTEEATDAQ